MNYQSSLGVTSYSLSENEYLRLRLEEGYIYDLSDSWEIYRPYWNNVLVALGVTPLGVTIIDKDNTALLYTQEDVLVLLDFERNRIKVSVAAKDHNSALEHVEKLRKIYPPTPESLDGKIKVNFWYVTTDGVRSIPRSIAVPKWESIVDNYNAKTLENLKYLMRDFKPSTGGQLIIWQGSPGTGKSYALRSLLYEWRDWCTAEYVLDPEALFSNSGYLAELILKRSFEFDADALVEDTDSKWKVFILEDSGEMLSADAKERVGQGLSRLLNLVDGFIGQGLKILVLITTNEDFGKLHPAVSREGRCAAAVKFKSFSYEQATTWMQGKELLPQIKEYTLAELFALRKETEIPLYQPDIKQIGFQLRGNA